MTTVKLSENAVKELKRVAQEQDMDLEKNSLRVGVKGGGCSGFMYDLSFEESKDSESDRQYEQDGIKIMVDKRSELYLEGTTIDFYEDLNQRGFTFDNPNAVKSCGCNKSFSA